MPMTMPEITETHDECLARLAERQRPLVAQAVQLRLRTPLDEDFLKAYPASVMGDLMGELVMNATDGVLHLVDPETGHILPGRLEELYSTGVAYMYATLMHIHDNDVAKATELGMHLIHEYLTFLRLDSAENLG